MSPHTPASTTRSAMVRRFAGGAAMGVLIASVPFAAGHPFQLSSLEMLAAARWVVTQDAGESFPAIVKDALTHLGYPYVASQL